MSNNEYLPPDVQISRAIKKLIDAIDNYPGEDPKRALDSIEEIIRPFHVTNNNGTSYFDEFISNKIKGVRKKVDGEWPVQRRNTNSGFNITEDVYDKQQEKVGRRAGLLPYVYAYLTGKDDVVELFMEYIGDTEEVFSNEDAYGYTIADYALESKDFDLYYKIIEDGGELRYYSSNGAPVPGEEPLPERNAGNVGQHFIHYTNSNIRRIIDDYITSKNELNNTQRAILRKKIIQRPSAPPASMGTYKHTVTDEPAFGHKTFRKKRYESKKDLIMPVESMGIREWIQAQTEYINSSKRITYIVKSYTRHGDEFVNMYLRNILFDDKGVLHPRARELLESIRGHQQNIPYMYQIVDNYERIIHIYKKLVTSKKIEPYTVAFPSRGEIVGAGSAGEPLSHAIKSLFSTFRDLFDRREILEELLQLYAYELNDIIEKSPKLPDNILVYRGSKMGQQVKQGKTDYVLPGFLSTSLNFFVPLKRFAEYHFPIFACCLYEIKIPKDIPVLYAAAVSHFKNEHEVLLPFHSIMHSSDKLLVKRVYGYEDRVLVTEMEVKGIRGTKSMRLPRTMLKSDRRVTHRRKSKRKRSVRKSRKASAKKISS